MIRRFLRALGRDRRGTLAVEAAMAVPVLAVLLLGGIEITRFVLLNQKLERTSATVADLVSRSEKLYAAELPTVFMAAGFTFDPFDLADDGRVIVSSIYKTSGTPARVVWQRAYGAGSGSSTFGVQGANAVLPAGFIVRDGENVIVSETFFDFVPLFTGDMFGVLEARTLSTHSLMRPRFGPLTVLY
jgi:Flp pilus assembly protein TadG